MKRVARVFARVLDVRALALALALAACTRAAPDSTPDGVVRLFLDRMESSADDPHAMKDAYALLGPRARANLKERADRAGRGQGKRYEPWEMLAEGRFGLKFRPKQMTSKLEGDGADVDVRGDAPEDHAVVHCIREGASWRIELELPEPPTATTRSRL